MRAARVRRNVQRTGGRQQVAISLEQQSMLRKKKPGNACALPCSLVSCACLLLVVNTVDRSFRRTIATIRTSIRLEAPIAERGNLVVPHEYIRYLVRVANEKMARSHDRARRFHTALASLAPRREEVVKSALSSYGMAHAYIYTRSVSPFLFSSFLRMCMIVYLGFKDRLDLSRLLRNQLSRQDKGRACRDAERRRRRRR